MRGRNESDRVDETSDEQLTTGGGEERISHIGEGLASLDALLPELRSAGALRTLCLHGNQLTRLHGLHLLPQLTELNLSSNSLTTLQDSLGALTNLRQASSPPPRAQLSQRSGGTPLKHPRNSSRMLPCIVEVNVISCRLRSYFLPIL